MPFVNPIETVNLPGWFKGLNREADPFQIEASESPDCLNVDFGLRGAVSKRKGYTKFSTSDPAAMAAGDALFSWTQLGGATWLIYLDVDGDLFYTSGTAFTSAVVDYGLPDNPQEYPFSVASLNNKLYLTTLRDNTAPRRWDGATWTAMTLMVPDGVTGKFPRARHILMAHERCFAANVRYSGGAIHRSRVHFSQALDPEDWEALDFIDFAPDNGQEITGFVQFAESLIVFKNRSMFVLAGTDPASFTVYPLDQNLGTECGLTIVNVGPEVYFFDHLTGVWKYDGSEFVRIDDKINTYLVNGINQANVYKSFAFTYRNRYFLSVPWGSSTVPSRTFVYDPRIEAWTEYDFGVAGAAPLAEFMLATGVRGAVGVHRLFDGQSDAGSNIASYFKTAWLAPGGQAVRQRLRRLDMAISALGNFDITAEMMRDFVKDAYRTRIINTAPGGAIWDTSLWDQVEWGSGVEQILDRSAAWGDTWQVCQFKFSENAQGTFQINRLTLQISARLRIRGTS